MINWAIVNGLIRQETTITPNHATIDEAITQLEAEYSDTQLLLMEAKELESLIIESIINILNKRHGKEIKKNLALREKERRHQDQKMKNAQFDVKVLPFGKMKDLKDMGVDMDPETLEKLSNSIMDQLFGKKKKKEDKDDDEDEDDPGASFYL